ncbi:DUF6069 family protein [Pseudonocardia saturnea]
MSTSVDRPSTPTALPLPARRLLAVLGAVASAAGVWWITGPLAGIAVTVTTGGGPSPVGPAAVVAAALVASLAGWGLLAVLERTTRRPRAIWTRTAAVVLAVSLAGPLSSSTSGAAGTLTLVAMHLTTGTVLIGLLPARRCFCGRLRAIKQ